MYFTTETEARAHLETAGGYIWPFEANGKQHFQVIETAGELIGLLAGYDGRYNRAVAERAIMGDAAERAGLNSETPPVLWGGLVGDLLRAAAAEIAAEPAAAEPAETAADFLARVKARTGAELAHWPHYDDAERVFDGQKLANRGNVFVITMIDADGVNHAPLGQSGIFVVETEPGAIKALIWEAEVIDPAIARVEALGAAIKAFGDDATPESVMILWRAAGGLSVAGALTGSEDVGGPANGGRWRCPKGPIIVAGWNIGPRGGDIYSPPTMTARPDKPGETDNARALAAERLEAITREAAVKRTSATIRGFKVAAEADAARAKRDAEDAAAEKAATCIAQRRAVSAKSGRTGRARARAARKAHPRA